VADEQRAERQAMAAQTRSPTAGRGRRRWSSRRRSAGARNEPRAHPRSRSVTRALADRELGDTMPAACRGRRRHARFAPQIWRVPAGPRALREASLPKGRPRSLRRPPSSRANSERWRSRRAWRVVTSSAHFRASSSAAEPTGPAELAGPAELEGAGGRGCPALGEAAACSRRRSSRRRN
jgi:hypothetical protein